jgi:zinc protease
VKKLFLLLVMAGAVLSAQTSQVPSYKALTYPPLRPIRIPEVSTFTLPNGMKLYLLENHELPLVRGVALVRTGNLFDPANKVGLATITGMVMRSGGTATKSGDDLDEALENVAASVESQIQETYGEVTFSTLKENTDDVLATFHDVLTAPAFRQDKIDLAKTELRSSISRRNDEPHGIAEREFTEFLYGKDTPYGWRVEYATLDPIKRADLQAFYVRYFFPSNVMLAVQGDFSIPEMKSKLEKLFAGWTVQQPAVPPFPAVKKQAAPGVYLAAKTDVTQTFFGLGHVGGILRDKDYPALEVMADILGGGFRSRLFQRVRTQLGYAYSISGVWGANFQHPGLFEISGSTKSETTTETIQVIQEEVEKLRNSEVTSEELESAKQAVANSFVFNFDTLSKTLNRVLFYDYYGYPRDFINQYLAGIQAVTKADVQRVAREHLKPKNFTIVAVGNPKEFGKPLATLGPVTPINLAIPGPKGEPPQQQ